MSGNAKVADVGQCGCKTRCRKHKPFGGSRSDTTAEQVGSETRDWDALLADSANSGNDPRHKARQALAKGHCVNPPPGWSRLAFAYQVWELILRTRHLTSRYVAGLPDRPCHLTPRRNRASFRPIRSALRKYGCVGKSLPFASPLAIEVSFRWTRRPVGSWGNERI